MIERPRRATRNETLVPDPPLCRSGPEMESDPSVITRYWYRPARGFPDRFNDNKHLHLFVADVAGGGFGGAGFAAGFATGLAIGRGTASGGGSDDGSDGTAGAGSGAAAAGAAGRITRSITGGSGGGAADRKSGG